MTTTRELSVSRRSSRVPFDASKPIAKADLDYVLEAAQWTPTAHSMQNFQIVAIDDPKALEAISEIRSPMP